MPLLDDYLEFLSGRCRPNTVLAVACDLKVSFEVVGKTPKRVRPGDVLGFMTAQATGQPWLSPQLQPVADKSRGVSARTVRRRLSRMFVIDAIHLLQLRESRRLTGFRIWSYAVSVIGTRRLDGRAARGERILDAAAESLLRFGYSRVTINDVAQRAEVGKGTVYLHWRTREELFEAVLGRELAEALDEVAGAVLADPGSWQLHRVSRALFLALAQRPLLIALFRSDREVLGKFAGRRAVERARRRAMQLGEYLRLLSAHGQLREDLSADDLSLAFISVWMGFILFDPQDESNAGGSAGMAVNDHLERRADLLAATVQAAFGSGRAVKADDDEAMRAQVAAWLRRMADGDRAEPPDNEALAHGQE